MGANTCQRGERERERKTERERKHTDTHTCDCSACLRGRGRPACRVGRTGWGNHLRYLLKCEPDRYRGSGGLRLERGGHLCAAELWL